MGASRWRANWKDGTNEKQFNEQTENGILCKW